MKNIKKSKQIILLSIFILGIILVITGVILNKEKDKKSFDKNKEETENKEDLLGLDRLEAQKKVISQIENYIKEIPNLEEFLKENNKDSLTLNELKKKFKIDISAIEKSEYNCNLDETIIDFSNGFDDYKILISCDAFLLNQEWLWNS